MHVKFCNNIGQIDDSFWGDCLFVCSFVFAGAVVFLFGFFVFCLFQDIFHSS